MTLHEPRSACHGWRCEVPTCNSPRSRGTGYPSESAAIRAENRHIQQAHRALTAKASV